MRAGAAQVDITPKPGIHETLEKNGNRVMRWRVALDPLYAKALVLEQDGRKLCIVQVDLNAVDNRCTSEIRHAAAEKCGFDEAAVLVHATQTHSGPQLGYRKDRSVYHREPADFWNEFAAGDDCYREFAVERILHAICEAAQHLVTASVGVGSAVEGRCAFNRRMVTRSGGIRMPLFMDREDSRYLEGPIDPELGVVSILGESLRPIAMLLNYTCHPVNLHPTRFETTISADWPGALANEMQIQFGDALVPLVLNGPCGNINPWDPWDPHYVRDHVRDGRLLADTATRVVESLDYNHNVPLDWCVENIGLPWRRLNPRDVQKAKQYLSEYPQAFWSDESRKSIAYDWTYAATLVDFDERREEQPNYDYEIQVLRIGDIAIVSLPGEPFVEIGLRIKLDSPLERTFVLSCPRWWECAYLPTLKAFERGGYETGDWLARFIPKALDMIGDAALEVLRKLCTK